MQNQLLEQVLDGVTVSRLMVPADKVGDVHTHVGMDEVVTTADIDEMHYVVTAPRPEPK